MSVHFSFNLLYGVGKEDKMRGFFSTSLINITNVFII